MSRRRRPTHTPTKPVEDEIVPTREVGIDPPEEKPQVALQAQEEASLPDGEDLDLEHPDPEGYLPDHWSEQDVARWRLWRKDHDGDDQVDGYWVFDPTRSAKSALDYTDDELLLWISGQLANPTDDYAGALVDEYRTRTRVDPRWYPNQVLAFYRTGSYPVRTDGNVLVHDRERDHKPAHEWSITELRAWHEGLIDPGDVADPTSLAMQCRERGIGIETHPITPSTSSPLLSTLSPIVMNRITTQLNRYVELTQPNRVISEEEGSRVQNGLENVFRTVLKQDGPKFVEAMDMVMNVVRANRDGVFHPDRAHRFSYLIKGDFTKRAQHNQLLDALYQFTDPTRARTRQLDPAQLLNRFSNTDQAKLVEYFHRISQ